MFIHSLVMESTNSSKALNLVFVVTNESKYIILVLTGIINAKKPYSLIKCKVFSKFITLHLFNIHTWQQN